MCGAQVRVRVCFYESDVERAQHADALEQGDDSERCGNTSVDEEVLQTLDA